MSHNIDLNSLNVRTDLAIEEVSSENTNSTKVDGITVTNVVITKDNQELYNKKNGDYITIEFEDATDYNNGKKIEKVLIDEINKMLIKMNIKKDDKCLIIGLGNDKSTPDSLGPLTINNIIVTNHFFQMGINVEEGFRSTEAINTGVMGETGNK